MAVVFRVSDLCDYVFASAWDEGIQTKIISISDLDSFCINLMENIEIHASDNPEFKYVIMQEGYYYSNDRYMLTNDSREFVYYMAYSENSIWLIDKFIPTDEHKKLANRYKKAFGDSDVVPNALRDSYLDIKENLIADFQKEEIEKESDDKPKQLIKTEPKLIGYSENTDSIAKGLF